MKKLNFPFILILAVVLLSACAPSSETLIVNEAWARPAFKGENGAAYFVIENGTVSNDTLLSVSSDIATATEVHMSMMDGNAVMSMQMQEEVPIPAGKSIEFKPGGLHVMLIGLNQDLKAGDTISLTLNFEKTGSLVIEIPVKEQ